MSKLLRTSLLACAAGAVLLPAAAQAQVEEIVVTARRVEERLQDVPSSITALSAEELADRQISSFTDLKSVVPNLNMQTQFGQPGTPQITMRGISSGLLSFPVDSGNALYIDGIYLGRSVGAAFGIADVERVEVLRGPQGTLFGRNSTGGAINFVTKAPSGVLGGSVDATVGNFKSRRVKATIDTPNFGGLTAKLTFVHNEHDGNVRSSTPGTTWQLGHYGTIKSAKSFGELDENSFLGALRYTSPDGRLQLDYKADYTRQHLSQLAVQALGFTPTEGLAQGLVALQPSLGGNVPVSKTYLSTLPLDFNSSGLTRVMGHALVAQYDFSEHFTLKNILSYRSLKQFSGGNDIDGGAWKDPFAGSGAPFLLLDSVADRKQHQWTDEVQAIGKFDRFDYIVGFFYYNEKASVDNSTFIFKTVPGGNTGPITPADYVNGEFDNVHNKARAAYGHLTAHLIEDLLDFSGGVRYSEDDRYVLDKAPPAGFVVPSAFKAGFNSTDWDAAITYKFTPDVNVYAKVATGYLSGGVLKSAAFAPESIISYEVGTKSEWFDKKLRFNAALFRTDRKNVQIASFAPGLGTTITNSGRIRRNGAEIEALFAPVQGLTFNASLGISDQVGATGAAAVGGAAGAVREASPDKNINLGAEYSIPVMNEGAVLTGRLDTSWTGKYSGFTTALADKALESALLQGGKWDINARLSLTEFPLGGAKGRISVWGRNLSNNHQIEFTRDLGLLIVGSFQVPRTYGIDLGVSF